MSVREREGKVPVRGGKEDGPRAASSSGPKGFPEVLFYFIFFFSSFSFYVFLFLLYLFQIWSKLLQTNL
jgi:hypothetical protein